MRNRNKRGIVIERLNKPASVKLMIYGCSQYIFAAIPVLGYGGKFLCDTRPDA
jgi:hypothetical protein